ncbi:MAG: DUF3147 family protein [Candidatus Riflebacteria bacterium]|nr:DUF3147 family protein [Candidatus Riflebacteria bacterium]
MQYFVKILLTTILVIIISEGAKRNQTAGAILASLPVTSILALAWFYHETGSKERTAALASDISIMVLPSLAFFLALPLMLRRDFSFPVAVIGSSTITAVCYAAIFKVATIFR